MHWSPRALLLCLALGSASVGAADPANDWPQFRGPQGDGVARQAKPPTTWGDKDQVKWSTPIRGKGWASPVIAGNRIWIATATDDGRELSLLGVDAATGRIESDRKLFEVAAPQFCHKFNSYASPTPVVAEGRAYVTFGSPGTACLDAETGKALWERRDFECNHYRGAGSSPILHGDLLLMHFDGSSHQYLVALRRSTGETAWRVNRSIDFKDLDAEGKPAIEGDLRKAFATPHVAVIEGVPTLLSKGAKALYAYLPATGEELWRVEERQNHSASTRPLYANGLVYAPTGFSQGQVLAIRPGRKGEVIDANADAPLLSP
jgi:outer membrane protein assembly factor BamB